jgi:translation elongation factor EF-Tu-like GTPase
MPTKAKGKKKKSPSRKTAARKSVKKKSIKKKAAAKIAKKKILKKKAAKKKTAKKAAPKAVKKATVTKKTMTVEPGPQPVNIPPVEEPTANEEAIATVTHYYSHLGVAVVQINKSVLTVGDQIRIKGHTTDFSQQVESMEYEHQHVDQASAGQNVGLRVKDHVREHDIVYLVK